MKFLYLASSALRHNALLLKQEVNSEARWLCDLTKKP